MGTVLVISLLVGQRERSWLRFRFRFKFHATNSSGFRYENVRYCFWKTRFIRRVDGNLTILDGARTNSQLFSSFASDAVTSGRKTSSSGNGSVKCKGNTFLRCSFLQKANEFGFLGQWVQIVASPPSISFPFHFFSEQSLLASSISCRY